MSIRNLFLLSLTSLTLAACSSDIFLVHNGNMPASEKIAQINKGQTREQVAQILGSPSAVSSFDGKTWIYMSSTLKKVAFCKPEEIKRDILTVSFDNSGKVNKILKYDRQDGQAIKADNTQTPVVGHEIGFFEKYFGGVGAYMPVSPTKNDGL